MEENSPRPTLNIPQRDLEKGSSSPPSLDREYIVKWAPNDPLNPQNWSDRYRWWVTFQLGLLAFVGSLGSSILTPADDTIAAYIGVSNEVSVLSLSLYV